MSEKARKTLLLITQVYLPDPSGGGQYMADIAREMVGRGWRVRVYTANRGYDDPAQKFPSREILDGVEIRRFPFSSLGKRSVFMRLLGQIFFLEQCVISGIFIRNLKCVLATTSPPMGSAAALLIRLFRSVSIKWWVLDLNPDQAVEMGIFKPNSLPVKVFDWLNRQILRKADDVIALDRFMVDRLVRKTQPKARLTIIPPWPLQEHLIAVPHDENPFRRKYRLEGKFVIMYSGNHSLCHPLTTILETAQRLVDNPKVVFFFIGGGKGKKEIEEYIAANQSPNIVSLPYQPMDQIKYSLSAADVHLVALGDRMVGCNHPCKFYGALALGKPVLYLGPEVSHISDILDRYQCGWQVSHSDVEGFTNILNQCLEMEPMKLSKIGKQGQNAIKTEFTTTALRNQFCNLLEN